ncbi:MAG: hypothetical protein V7K88_13555 [Nostoc sp.]|uniref:hypothetical protein n=1 Tax=Nostoc sp. TaxID=1180 RepID=UPI002FF79D8B
MDGNEVLASALVKMATSPVKADRDAIARLERECKTDITKIATALEDSQIVVQAMNATESLGIGLKILAAGLFWSSVIGLATMFVRPNYLWYGVSLGFISGAAGRMEIFKS